MKRYWYIFVIGILMLTQTSCTTSSNLTRGEVYAKLYEEKPISILVMPPINNTSNVEAKDLLYTSISRNIAEAGYYVISPIIAMDVLRNESAYDAEYFINSSLGKFKEYFGAFHIDFLDFLASVDSKDFIKSFNREITYRSFLRFSFFG